MKNNLYLLLMLLFFAVAAVISLTTGGALAYVFYALGLLVLVLEIIVVARKR